VEEVDPEDKDPTDLKEEETEPPEMDGTLTPN